MTPQRWQQVKQIFHAALDRAGDGRAAFIEQACGSDGELRSKLAELLQRHDQSGSFMETLGPHDPLRLPIEMDTLPTPASGASYQVSQSERPGTVIGRYKLLELLGEGGFGSVYRAEQQEPVRRTVALKLIKLGMDTRQVIARFEAERQALAVMDHPHVAKVFDAGATDTGRPYFVMEFVQGVPITEHCDRHKLSIRERLELFIQVCEAVQHAHQKGIIHRDIKPSNILVEFAPTPPSSPLGRGGHGGVGVPKVIDFGVAKAITSPLTNLTLHTERGQLIGTPAYMSPEQADLSAQDIDTRSDIYSLGVLLYELLTGTLPFEPTQLRSAGLAEIQRIIREVEPPTPSTKLNRIQPAPATRKLVRGDLDWITMKALEKDRTRRYASASDLAADIRRHLINEPVIARPPSAFYRFEKFARRNQIALWAVWIVFVIVCTGVIGFVQVAKSRERAVRIERDRALEAKQEADTQRDAALAARAAERKEASKHQAVNQFLQDMLSKANRGEQKGNPNVTVREIVDAGARDLESGAARYEPEVEMAIRRTIGLTYQALGLLEQAQPLLTGALRLARELHESDDADVAAGLHDLGLLRYSEGDYSEAARLLREALDMLQRLHGAAHFDIATSLNTLAVMHMIKGEYDAAEPLFRRALAQFRKLSAEECPEAAICLGNLGYLAMAAGDYEAAESLVREALALFRKLGLTDHPDLSAGLTNLGELLRLKGDAAAAEPLMREALALDRKLWGDEHISVARGLNNLALVVEDRGDPAAAAPLLEESLALRRKLLGDKHPDVATAQHNLAFLYQGQGDYDAAEAMMRQALELRRELLGDDHALAITSLHGLAYLLRARGQGAIAEPMYREVLAQRRRLLGNTHPDVANCLHTLANLLHEQGDLRQAESLYREALGIRLEKLPGSVAVALSRVALGACLVGLEQLDEAESLLCQGWSEIERMSTASTKLRRRALEALVKLYEAREAAQPGAGFAEQAAAWQAMLDAMGNERP